VLFYEEALQYMRSIAEQFDNLGELRSRFFAELKMLHAETAKEHGRLAAQLDLSAHPQWAALAQRVLKSPFLHEQIVEAAEKLESVARALNERMPGEPFGVEHELEPLGALVADEHPELATLLQMMWARKPRDLSSEIHPWVCPQCSSGMEYLQSTWT
jgi:hypothetical protein